MDVSNQNSEVQNNLIYLTESSYRQLIITSDITTFDLEDVKTIFNQIYDNWKFYKMFNKSDYKFLYKSYLLLSGDSEGIFYKEVEDRKDDLHYILELKGKLKYHLNPKCERLNSGFRNFFVPEPIAIITDENKKKELVNEIRNWFKINNYTVAKYNNNEITDKILTESFNSFFPDKFNIDKITISQSDNNQFKWYVQKKTDTVKIEYEFNINDFKRNANNIISDRNKLCKISTPWYNLSKYDFLQSESQDVILTSLNEKINKGYLKEVTLDFIQHEGVENLVTFWKQHIELRNRAKQEFTERKFKFQVQSTIMID